MLKEWYEKNPNKKLNGKRFYAKDCASLNSIQKQHLNGELNIYSPIKTYIEEWKTILDGDGNYVSAYPVPDTRRRDDLAPVAIQWQQDYKKRFCKGK